MNHENGLGSSSGSRRQNTSDTNGTENKLASCATDELVCLANVSENICADVSTEPFRVVVRASLTLYAMLHAMYITDNQGMCGAVKKAESPLRRYCTGCVVVSARVRGSNTRVAAH